MFSSRTPGLSRLNKTQKASMAGVAAAGVAAVTFSLVPGNGGSAEAGSTSQSKPASASQVAWSSTTDGSQASAVHAIIAKQHTSAKATASDKTKSEADAKAKAAAKAKAEAKAKADAKKRAKTAASRSATRKPVYPNNLDGWIRESLAIMKKHGIPGSYNGIHRNIIRESSGNPKAINLWDINAQNGIPSKGLLQVIPPTFKAYHVKGTPNDIYNPVSNIVAACNYAADKYGSMDNVNSAY
ncbi:transglycosylase SLT domain-containing protein [Streptomyces corynorhini]|uniref:Lytic transglycosylase n=1 Tax=Streptomyces corynorhini TaxID=2282652 RepID=A0A370BIU1_9ACTN|nr:transglycosylase SLT domain-containing protein [Streptomyces corynorhini]RDG39683.1 lytic transglycosylase [Streptomyces corynorhini]